MPRNPLEEFVPTLPVEQTIRVTSRYLSQRQTAIQIPVRWFDEAINDGETLENVVSQLEHHLSGHRRASEDGWQSIWYYCYGLESGEIQLSSRYIVSINQTFLELCIRFHRHIESLGYCFINRRVLSCW